LLFEAVPDDWRECLQRLACSSLHCSASLLQAERLREINAAGVPVACYTVNHPDQAQRLFSDGVRAIFSDRIDLFADET
jgi:glycerophosphoryl diester phosphodiesterase